MMVMMMMMMMMISDDDNDDDDDDAINWGSDILKHFTDILKRDCLNKNVWTSDK